MDDNDANQKLNLLVKAIEVDVERNNNTKNLFANQATMLLIHQTKSKLANSNNNKISMEIDNINEDNDSSATNSRASSVNIKPEVDEELDDDGDSNLDSTINSNSNLSNTVSTTSADEIVVPIKKESQQQQQQQEALQQAHQQHQQQQLLLQQAQQQLLNEQYQANINNFLLTNNSLLQNYDLNLLKTQLAVAANLPLQHEVAMMKLAAIAGGNNNNTNNNTTNNSTSPTVTTPTQSPTALNGQSKLLNYPLFIGKNGKPTRPFKAYPKEPLSMPLGCTPAFNLPFQLNSSTDVTSLTATINANNNSNNNAKSPISTTANASSTTTASTTVASNGTATNTSSPSTTTSSSANAQTVENIIAALAANNNYGMTDLSSALNLNSFDFNAQYRKRIQQAKNRIEIKNKAKSAHKQKHKLKDMDIELQQQQQQQQQPEPQQVKSPLNLAEQQQKLLATLLNAAAANGANAAALAPFLLENSIKLSQNDEINKINEKFQPIINLNQTTPTSQDSLIDNKIGNDPNITLIPPPKKRHRVQQVEEPTTPTKMLENDETNVDLQKLQQQQQMDLQPKLKSLAELMIQQYQQQNQSSSSPSSASPTSTTPSSSSLSLSSCSSISSTSSVSSTLDDESSNNDTYRERRRKNNEAAKRSRDARRAKEDEIALRAAILERENLQLKVELAQLKQETNKLRCMLYNS